MGVSSGCINHPGIEAVARCKQCAKPVCGTCVVKGPTGAFCSDACKETHAAYVNRAQQLDDMKRRPGILARFKGVIGTGVVIVIVVFAAAFVATYFGIEIPVLSNIVRQVLNR